MSITSKGYNLGLSFEQGIGVSENSGHFPMPEARTGVVIVEDVNDQPHVIVLDFRDGKFYDISTRTGPTGSNISKTFKDKVEIDGTGGYDIAPQITFKSDTGESEHYDIDHSLSKFYMRPVKASNRGASGYDANGFPDGLELTADIFTDGEKITETAKSEDIGIKGDVVYDRKATGNRLQTKLSSNKGEIRLIERQQYYVAKDIPVSPDSRVTTEGDRQSSLSSPLMWYTRRDGLYLDRVTGASVSGSPVALNGPDGKNNTAFQLSEAKEFGTITDTSSKTVFFWCSGADSGSVALDIGGTPIALTNYNNSGGWYLNYATEVADSGVVTLTPTGTDGVFDFEAYTGNVSGSLDYYFRDVTENDGNNTLPLM